MTQRTGCNAPFTVFPNGEGEKRMADFEIQLNIRKDNPEDIVSALRVIANRIEKGIYVSMYDPFYTMKYPDISQE